MLLSACLQAKQHGSYNIYVGVHSIVPEERWELRAGFFFLPVSVEAQTGLSTVGFSSIGLVSFVLPRRATFGKPRLVNPVQVKSQTLCSPRRHKQPGKATLKPMICNSFRKMQNHCKNQYFICKPADARHLINYKCAELLLCFGLLIFLFYTVRKTTIKANKFF